MRLLSHAVLAVLIFAAPAAAQTTKALDVVPDDALGFILIKDVRSLSDHVEQFAKKLKVHEQLSLLKLIHSELGVREGLNDNGSVVYIVLPCKDKKSRADAVMAVPVTDFQKVARQLGVKQFNQGIGEGAVGGKLSMCGCLAARNAGEGKAVNKLPVLVAAKDSFALLTGPENRAALECVLNSRKSIAASLQGARDWLEQQEICGVCTHHGIQAGIAAYVGLPGEVTGKRTSEQSADLKGFCAKVEKNVKRIAFGARLGKSDNLRLLARAYFEPDSTFAKWFTKTAPLRGKVLADLPSEGYILAAVGRISGHSDFKPFTKVLWEKLSPGEQGKQLSLDAAQLLHRISEVGVGVYADHSAKQSAPGEDFHAAVIARVDNASTFIDGAVKLFEQTRQAVNRQKGNKHDLQVKYEQRQIAGKPSRLIVMTKSTEGKPWAILLTELDPRTVLACCLPSADGAEAAVKTFTSGSAKSLTTDAALQKTALLLPPRRIAAGYLNVQMIERLILGRSGALAPMSSECPPLGMALSTFPGGVEREIVIPFETLQAVVKDFRRAKEQK